MQDNIDIETFAQMSMLWHSKFKQLPVMLVFHIEIQVCAPTNPFMIKLPGMCLEKQKIMGPIFVPCHLCGSPDGVPGSCPSQSYYSHLQTNPDGNLFLLLHLSVTFLVKKKFAQDYLISGIKVFGPGCLIPGYYSLD